MGTARNGSTARALGESDGRVAGGARQRIVLAGTEQVAKVGVWQLCPETTELRWSDNLFRLHGLEPGEGVPSRRVLLGVTHPDDRVRVVRYADNLLRERIPPPLDFRVISPRGGVRYLRSTVSAVDRDSSHALLIIGSVQDVTAARRAEREIASRFAVTSALAAWESFEQGMKGLLRDLAGAIGARAGSAWLREGDLLVAKVFWSGDVAATAEFEASTRSLRLPPGSGLPGRVWQSKTPAVELTASPECERREPAARAAVRGLVAIPVVHAGEPLAIMELASAEEITLTQRLARSLIGIGYEVGEFLGHRRGELVPPALTARELEVLQLAAYGYSGRQIAERLRISPATIKTHFEHIYAKFGVRGRTAAVAQALRAGLIA